MAGRFHVCGAVSRKEKPTRITTRFAQPYPRPCASDRICSPISSVHDLQKMSDSRRLQTATLTLQRRNQGLGDAMHNAHPCYGGEQKQQGVMDCMSCPAGSMKSPPWLAGQNSEDASHCRRFSCSPLGSEVPRERRSLHEGLCGLRIVRPSPTIVFLESVGRGWKLVRLYMYRRRWMVPRLPDVQELHVHYRPVDESPMSSDQVRAGQRCFSSQGCG